jgi:hypothetical protein
MGDKDNTATLIAALVSGDRWLNADAAAVFLGLVTPDGQPNRRRYLEQVACKPGYPKPLQHGTQKVWKKSEIDLWAEEERRSNQAA